MAVPSRFDRGEALNGAQGVTFLGSEAVVEFRVLPSKMPTTMRATLFAPADSALGRSPLGGVPLHYVLEMRDFTLQAGHVFTFNTELRLGSARAEPIHASAAPAH